MRTNTFGKRIFALIMTVLMICSVVLCNGTMDVFGATFSKKSPFKNYETGKAKTITCNHNSKFKGYLMLDGADISAWQDELNSSKVSSNLDFVIIRTSYTGLQSSFAIGSDKKFAEHYKNAKAAGKLIGVYEFSQAKTPEEATKEADFLVKQLKTVGVKPADLALPVYMDYEFSSGGRLTSSIKKATATKCARAFCERIKELGYVPGIYANKTFLTNTIDGAALSKDYDIWCAQWSSQDGSYTCTFEGNYSKWQYTDAARVEGIYNNGKKTNVDADFWYIDKNRISASSSDIASCTFTVPEKVLYTGSSVKPDVTVANATGTLKKNTDYAIHYINNVNKGTGYAYIVGLGNYSGYKLISFNIVSTLDVLGVDDLELTDKGIEAGYSLTDAGLEGVVASTKVSAVKASVALKDKESGYVISIADKSGKALSKSTVVTTGDKLTISDDTGEVLGSIVIKVQGTKAKFISLKGGKKKITLKWKKLASSKATGYQIQYCQYEDMPSDYSETKTIKSYKTVSTTLKTNFGERNYYVKIRSYKTIRSKKNYSPWSAVKSVKVK